MGKTIDTIRSWFCKHEWELLNKSEVYETNLAGTPLELPLRREWLYICKKCMKTKKITT